MPQDVLLIIGEPKIRAKIKRMLNESGKRFRFLGEAGDGHIGLEKAHLLNPDIILLYLWSGFISGRQLLEELHSRNYMSKVLVIQQKEEKMDLSSYQDVYGIISEDDLSESTVFEALDRIAAMDLKVTEQITSSLYGDILSCQSLIEFSMLMNDKHHFNFDFDVDKKLILWPFDSCTAI